MKIQQKQAEPIILISTAYFRYMRKEVGFYGSYARTFILNVRQCFVTQFPVLSLPIRLMVLPLMCSCALLILSCRNCLLYRNIPMSYGE